MNALWNGALNDANLLSRNGLIVTRINEKWVQVKLLNFIREKVRT